MTKWGGGWIDGKKSKNDQNKETQKDDETRRLTPSRSSERVFFPGTGFIFVALDHHHRAQIIDAPMKLSHLMADRRGGNLERRCSTCVLPCQRECWWVAW